MLGADQFLLRISCFHHAENVRPPDAAGMLHIGQDTLAVASRVRPVVPASRAWTRPRSDPCVSSPIRHKTPDAAQFPLKNKRNSFPGVTFIYVRVARLTARWIW